MSVRSGVDIVADWTVVTTPMAQAALRGLCGSFIGTRWRGMDEAENRVHRYVLQGYAATGRAPAGAQIAGAVGPSFDEVTAALRRLAGRDLVVLDDAGRIVGAYPFTERPSEHHVTVAGITVSAMCAIDALGIGAMLGQASVIRSVCRSCGQTLSIRTRDNGQTLDFAKPAGIVIWSGQLYADDCAATSLCTQQGFFCTSEHMERWRADKSRQDDEGVPLNLSEALEVGRALFEAMRSALRLAND
jgi:hypothetical protein